MTQGLSEISKPYGRDPFRAPAGYFADFERRMTARIATMAHPTPTMAPRPRLFDFLPYFAAAAVVTVCFVLGGKYVDGEPGVLGSHRMELSQAAAEAEEMQAYDYLLINTDDVYAYATEN